MKKTFILFTLSLGLILTSCSTDNSVSEKVESNESLKAIISEHIKLQNENIKKTNGFQFDFNNMVQTYPQDANGMEVITAYEVNYDKEAAIQTAMNFVIKNGEVVDEVVVTTDATNSNLKELHMYEPEDDGTFFEFGTYQFDTVNETVIVVSTKPRPKPKKPCGQLVADCIQDAYSQHGWASVALWVTSAYFPETTVIVVVNCYDINC